MLPDNEESCKDIRKEIRKTEREHDRRYRHSSKEETPEYRTNVNISLCAHQLRCLVLSLFIVGIFVLILFVNVFQDPGDILLWFSGTLGKVLFGAGLVTLFLFLGLFAVDWIGRCISACFVRRDAGVFQECERFLREAEA